MPPNAVQGSQTTLGVPQATPQAPSQPALDPSIVNLARAISKTETRGQKNPYAARGGSGEYGAYQYTAPTWAADSQKYLGSAVPLDQATPEQQDKVAYYKIKDLGSAGHTAAQIASIWNSGKPDPTGNVGINKFGVKFDTPQYVKSVGDVFDQLQKSQEPTPALTASTVGNTQVQTADEKNASETGATFPSNTQTPDGTTEVAKTLGNIPASIFGTVKGILNMMNPINIAKNLGQDVSGLNDAANNFGGGLAGWGKALTTLGTNIVAPGENDASGNAPRSISNLGGLTQGAAYKTLMPEAGQGAVDAALGAATGNPMQEGTGLQTAQRNITNNPVGSILPFLLALEGGAKGVDNLANKSAMADYVDNIKANTDAGIPVPQPKYAFSGALENTAKKLASPIQEGIPAIADKVGGFAKNIAQGGFSQATGIQPSDIATITKFPDEFTSEKIGSYDRSANATAIKEALDKRISDLQETGAGYEAIRNSETPVKVDQNFLRDQIQKMTGLDIGEDTLGKGGYVEKPGEINASGSSVLRDTRDVNAIRDLYNRWQPHFQYGEMTPNEFLNFRTDLAKLSKFGRDIGSSAPLESVAQRLRGQLNTSYRGQLAGLEDTDATFSSQKTELNALKRNILNKDGTLNPNAANRIANSLGKGKDAMLSQLEELKPGITKDISIGKAKEAIQALKGNVVGTYGRTAGAVGSTLGGFAVGGAPGAIVGALADLIISSPSVAVPILRAIGKGTPLYEAVIEKAKLGGGAINNLPTNFGVRLPAATSNGGR